MIETDSENVFALRLLKRKKRTQERKRDGEERGKVFQKKEKKCRGRKNE